MSEGDHLQTARLRASSASLSSFTHSEPESLFDDSLESSHSDRYPPRYTRRGVGTSCSDDDSQRSIKFGGSRNPGVGSFPPPTTIGEPNFVVVKLYDTREEMNFILVGG